MKMRRNLLLLFFAVTLSCSTGFAPALAAFPQDKSAVDPLSYAICPIIYPLDQEPSERGFHYLFYGNAFFINNEGYLLTAAHVLSELTDSQPYIVLRLPMAPPRILKTTVVAIDHDHDVALLRATPNPFEGKYEVRYLALSVDWPARQQAVLAAALRPSRIKDPHTFDAFVEDRPAGQALEYEFSQLDKERPSTRLLLFSHGVLLGDSGAPVVSGDSKAVVGLVEGRWLRTATAALATTMAQSASGVGAVVPIHYAIPLLLQNGVAWRQAPSDGNQIHADPPAAVSSEPVPLSLVAAPYPTESLEGGEVVLAATVEPDGQVSDINTVAGRAPFLDEALIAVNTWTFRPAPNGDTKPPSRIGIIFQFAQPGAIPSSNSVRTYDIPAEDAPDRPARPMLTREPQVATNTNGEAGVILSVHIDAKGQPGAIEVLQDHESLAAAISASVRDWQFSPAKCAGANCDSTVFVVVIPRHRPTPVHVQPHDQER
jgi:outer membrane biosynthesis protein TonB